MIFGQGLPRACVCAVVGLKFIVDGCMAKTMAEYDKRKSEARGRTPLHRPWVASLTRKFWAESDCVLLRVPSALSHFICAT